MIEDKKQFARFLGSFVAGAIAGVFLGWLASRAAAPYLVGAASFVVVGGLVWRNWGRVVSART